MSSPPKPHFPRIQALLPPSCSEPWPPLRQPLSRCLSPRGSPAPVTPGSRPPGTRPGPQPRAALAPRPVPGSRLPRVLCSRHHRRPSQVLAGAAGRGPPARGGATEARPHSTRPQRPRYEGGRGWAWGTHRPRHLGGTQPSAPRGDTVRTSPRRPPVETAQQFWPRGGFSERPVLSKTKHLVKKVIPPVTCAPGHSLVTWTQQHQIREAAVQVKVVSVQHNIGLKPKITRLFSPGDFWKHAFQPRWYRNPHFVYNILK